ncbi:hypothetical protein [Pseudomonas veronii]|uniref:hypothetical protein n=1 Tax=Pseudomonas veronii TaxID=76761 RepID=UPI0021BE5E96|nr:hypothetical protein [Pseudomonas veronii]MCT9826635.1 hypothetical protein [Pseudomonas veronii]
MVQLVDGIQYLPYPILTDMCPSSFKTAQVSTDTHSCCLAKLRPGTSSLIIAHVPNVLFDVVQAANRVHGFFSQPDFVRHVQIEKLAAGVGRSQNQSGMAPSCSL